MTNTHKSTEANKWGVCPVDPPGPRQVGAINKAIGRLRRAGVGEVTLEGVIGRPETERRLICLSGFMTSERNPLAVEREAAIGEAHGWTVSKKNAAAIRKELEAAYPEVEASRPVVDNRVPPEVEAERMERAAESMAEGRQRQEARDRRRAETHAPVLAKRPPRAVALIVAELDEDQSDSMTDYYAHRTTRTVAIGWRTGSREDFRQLRAAAAGFPETAHLGPDAPDDVEHRENYSMGAGNYVKGASRHCSGWKVRSYPLNDRGELPAYGLHDLEDGLPDAAPAPESIATDDGAAFSIVETENKRGPFFLVVQSARVDRSTFEALRESAKRAGGWYSRKWGRTPGGFGFSTREEAEAWAVENLRGDDPPPPSDPSGEREGEAERLEALADRMTEEVEHRRAPLSQNWTPRRGRIKDGQRAEADRLETVQRGLRAMAAALRENRLPAELATACALTRSGTYSTLHDYTTDARALARRASLSRLIEEGTTEEDRAAEQERADALELERLTSSARLRTVPGFFPTPPDVVGRMLEAAGVDLEAPTDAAPRLHFLEPSAGIGSIADALRPYVERQGGGLVLYEVAPDLCEVLRAKGYDSAPGCDVRCEDFLDVVEHLQQGERVRFDRILMNPPFERRGDVRHVTAALAHLEPGGRLVAIMTPLGAAIMETTHDAAVERLPEGSFTGPDAFRPTGVSARLVVIDKARATAPECSVSQVETDPEGEAQGPRRLVR